MSNKSTSSLSLQPSAFLPELKKLVTDLSEDLLTRSTESAEIDAGLREAYAQIEKGGRTAQAFEVWREDYLDQVAVAWVLACVFVRFMEDNHLIDECWLAGEGERRKLAEDTHELYFRSHPHQSDREYFEHIFHEVGKIPACRDLFAEGKTPLWAVGPSGDTAMKLLAFWREIDAETGHLARSFEVKDGDTRFLGDLYQDLSERARKKYALLQTPVFVEEFILDRTLDPAVDEFGLDEVRMIDPTCGSGHFLLGAFARLFDLWIKREDNEIVAAEKALNGVWGVDINPFAVAIARFRLVVAALRACDVNRLKDAPAWNIHLATGDSLLFGSRWDRDGGKKAQQQFLGTAEEHWAPEIYACEDKEAISEVLGRQYHAVVGNPPYITVNDAALNHAYRQRYKYCHRQYSLSVPFMERFFDLALLPIGYVGQITSNSFMKRDFGKKLVEEFVPALDVTHVIDTSGAYIPGHGTPTVIVLGRNRRPCSDTIRAVLGISGEPDTPKDASKGLVWQSILRHVDSVDSEDEFTSSADVTRGLFATHPWSLGGGGTAELKSAIEANSSRMLGDLISEVGRSTHTGEDEAFYLEQSACKTKGFAECTVPLSQGGGVRDYFVEFELAAIFPYGSDGHPIPIVNRSLVSHFWRYRTALKARKDFGQTIEERGFRWVDHSMFFPNRYCCKRAIAFPNISTHNHFVCVNGPHLCDPTAPMIILDNDCDDVDYISTCGLLNSSVACFWIKQVSHNKGSTVDQHGARQRTAPFEDFYQLNATRLRSFPLPTVMPSSLSQKINHAASHVGILTAKDCEEGHSDLQTTLHEMREKHRLVRSDMIALQEEIDWDSYRLYDLLDDEVCYQGDDLPGIQLGERAFEIVMAKKMARGELETTWFQRHGSKPITECPTHWPERYRKLVERRMELIETSKEIGLIERPEYKRRWNTEGWERQQQRALRNWLLDRLESQHYWPNPLRNEHRLQSVAELSDKASGDQDFLQFAAIYRGREDFDVAALVAELIESESVPFLPIMRYKSVGIRKRAVWERTWEHQRSEDAGVEVDEIKAPPKYRSADFQSSDIWRLRGKLDIPKERWISFPHCETESDPSLVVGWAGWDHLQQATALVAYYDARKREGWDAKRLTPLLAGLDQLLPWIHQWHPEVDPEFGETAGQSFQTMLEADAHELGLTLEEIRAWEPPKKKKGGRRKAKG